MSLNINAEYGKFVQFAQQQMNAGNDTAIARDGGERVIAAATGDKVAKMFRSDTDKQANDTARSMFRQAVIDMFGHESLIPREVRKAMKLDEDFDQGKPLTARRIMDVKAEVDKIVSKATAANNSAIRAIVEGHLERLPENMKAALSGLVDDLRGIFGAQLVPNDEKITDIIDVAHVRSALDARCAAANAEGREIMPEEIVAAFADKAVDRLVRIAAGTPLLAKLRAKNPDMAFTPLSIASQFNKCVPALFNEIRECTNAEQIAAVLQKYDGEMDKFVDVLVRADKSAKGVADKAAAKLAEALKLDKGLVAVHVPLAKLVSKANSLASSVGSGDLQDAMNDNFDMDAPFDALVEKFVQQRIAVCEEIDRLDMPASVKEAWKADYLANTTLPPLGPSRLLDVAKVLDVAKLESAIAPGLPMKIGAEMVNNMMKAVTDEMKKPDENGENPIEGAGVDDLMPLFYMLLSYAENKSANLAGAIDKAKKDMIPQANVYCEGNSYADAAMLFKTLAVKGGTKKDALITDKWNFAAAMESEVTSVLDRLAITDEKVRKDVKNALLGRGNGILAKATGLKEVSDFLSTLRANAEELAHALSEIQRLRTTARNIAVTTIVVSTGLKKDFVEGNLQIADITSDSGKLRFLYDDIVAKAKKGEPFSRYDTSNKASKMVTDFAMAKVAVIKAVNEAGFDEADRVWHVTGALSDGKWTDPQVVSVSREIARSESVKNATAKLVDALKDGNVQKLDDIQLRQAFLDFAKSYYDTFLGQFKEYAEKWAGDTDTFMRIDKMMLQFLVKENPQIADAMRHLTGIGRTPILEAMINDGLTKVYDLKMDYMTLANVDKLDAKAQALARGAMKNPELQYDEAEYAKCKAEYELYATANRLFGFVRLVFGA